MAAPEPPLTSGDNLPKTILPRHFLPHSDQESPLVEPSQIRHRRRPPQRRRTRVRAHEIFFSITDRKGVIRSGNEVFRRVSGYSMDEMVGRPHNLVRHPDMPRIVFKILWDEIGAGRPVAAYVKNRAADGRFYWVIATAMPTADGYLSIRIKPGSELFVAAQGIYRDLRDVERKIEGADGLRRKEAMEASGARLLDALRGAGFESYDAFMRAAVLTEVRLREAHLRESKDARRQANSLSRYNAFGGALSSLTELNGFFSELVLHLDEYIKLNTRLGENAAFVRELADEVRLFALNAIISASKAGGTDGAAIGAVAGLLRTHSESSSALFRALGDSVVAASETLGRMLFPVAAARLEGEMLQMFLAEFSAPGAETSDHAEVLALHACLEGEAAGLVALLNEFDRRMRSLHGNVQGLRRELETMRALGLNGRIEAARIEDAGQFTTLFATVGTLVAAASARLDELGKSGGSLFAHRNRSTEDIERAVSTVGALLHALAAPGETAA